MEIFKKEAGITNEDVAVVVIFDGCQQLHPSILEFFDFLDEELEIPHEKSLQHRRDVFMNQGKSHNTGSNPTYA